ncbi:ParA family protein [Paenibacillus sp. ACRSA]|uniref:ParA family protein n=1 Tax=Paenibacillus sp. ACRSA TaxID=2918211 RepID=UPI001EF52454|nr:ParA family protein [Paenibacillus sp. ACRSA]MCG7380054.1 ParA family protein [Paenibacillus sp. ACRSA]
MIITISISSTIGGSGKTTIACMFAHLLSANYKVLALDLCGQCNFTEVFIDNHAEMSTVCDAFEAGDVISHITPITKNLHVLPGDLWVSGIPTNLYIQGFKTTEIVVVLRDLLNRAKNDYDFVVVDCPSMCADELFNVSLSISDFAIMTYSPNNLNFIEKWLDRIRYVQDELNPNLKIGGILRTRFNDIEASHKFYNQEVYRLYPDYCWNSVFPNSPLFANIDSHSIQKSPVANAFKPGLDEMILRLLKTRNGIGLW